MTTSPGKNWPGQKGFPTPNAAIETSACRTFSVPAREDWLGLLMGAVGLLTSPHSYYQWGDLTPQQAADAFSDIVEAAYAQALTGQCTADVPTPFWDAATDIALEMPADSQVWYGRAGSFIEDVAIWGFAGLIVASLGIAGIAPALAYTTIAQKFVLAYKNDHAGATVKFFVDGFKVYQGTDSGDGTVSRVKVACDPSTDTHDILATADTGQGLSIVRKELTPAEISDPSQRYYPTCDCIQVTRDGGATWTDAPGLDPRHADAFRVPPTGSGDDYLCNVAARITAQFKETLTEFLSALSMTTFATTILGFIDVLFPGAGIVVDVILLIWDALVAIGSANIVAAFTDEVWTGIECIIRCHLRSDGTFGAAEVDAIKAQIFHDYPGTVSNTVSILFTLYGEVLSSNAGAERSETGDCTDCACNWTYRWDFGANNGGWVANALDGTGWGSGYVPACCWQGSSNAIAYHLPVGVHVVNLGANSSSPAAFAQASTNNSGTFIHRCDGGGCDVLDWTFTSGQWVYCFGFVEQIYWVDMHGTGARPALTGGAFI